MQNQPSHCCCCSCQSSADGQNRRGFFGQAVAIACGGAALAVPAVTGVAAFLNPLRQKGFGGEFLRLASLDVLPQDGRRKKSPSLPIAATPGAGFPPNPSGPCFCGTAAIKSPRCKWCVRTPAVRSTSSRRPMGAIFLPLPPSQFRLGRQPHRRHLAQPAQHGFAGGGNPQQERSVGQVPNVRHRHFNEDVARMR